MQQVRRLVRRGLELTGLIGPYFRWIERRQAGRASVSVDDGRPMPPRELIMVVGAAGGDEGWFSKEGLADAEQFRALALAHGVDLAEPQDVLDLGCGVGRIARWLAPELMAAGGGFQGCDVNQRLLDWCAANLQGRYFVNALQPPLPLPEASLDLVYAKSVFTHLREDTARAWLAEIARVLRPTGLAILTFADEDFTLGWAPKPVRPKVGRQRYIIWNDALEGSNYMSAWTTREHFAALAAPIFDVAEMVPGRRDWPAQAIAVLRPRWHGRGADSG